MKAKKGPRLPDYLRHILEAITQIESYTEGLDQQSFLASRIVQDAVIRNIEIIGEAANNILKLDSAFRKRHPELPLKAAYGMRNAVSHGYYLVDPVLVWGTLQTELPVLKDQIVAVLQIYTQP